jgi:hypothetical protein
VEYRRKLGAIAMKRNQPFGRHLDKY